MMTETSEPGLAPIRSESSDAPPMPAGFGLATATFVIVASMIGVGVLTTSGYTVVAVGSNQLMLGLWVVGGVVALCGALTLAELASALPEAGGDYVFLYNAYGPLAAFLSGWVSFLIGFAAPIAASASAMATYLLAPLDLPASAADNAQLGLATLAILIFAVIHTSGRNWTVHVQGWVTALKLIVLGLYVVAGVAAGWRHHANLADRPPLASLDVVAMLFSLVYISYGYSGWNAAAYLAGEIEEPERRLPRAILLGTGIVIVLYLGLNAVYGLALPAAEVKRIVEEQKNIDAVKPIAQLAAVRLFGPAVAAPLSVAIGLLMLSSLSAYVLTGPRVTYAMARAGQFPAIAGRLSSRTRTPAIATALQVAWALVLLWTGSFESILVYTGVGLALFSMLTISSIYALRVRRPDLPRPFRTPGYPIVPAIYLVVTAVLTFAAFTQRPRVSLYSLLTILAGVPFYSVWEQARRRAARGGSPSRDGS